MTTERMAQDKDSGLGNPISKGLRGPPGARRGQREEEEEGARGAVSSKRGPNTTGWLGKRTCPQGQPRFRKTSFWGPSKPQLPWPPLEPQSGTPLSPGRPRARGKDDDEEEEEDAEEEEDDKGEGKSVV